MLVLGEKGENVYRFSGFKPPKEFLPELEKALARHALYRQGKEWDAEQPRPAQIVEGAVVRTLPAPEDEVPAGLALLGGRLWVAQGAKLAELDAATGEVLRRLRLPASVRGLCSDGKLLYAVEYGWTAGHPIHVIDPAAGTVVRQIVTEANKTNRSYSAAAIAFREGRLWVLSMGKAHAVDPATGEVGQVLQLPDRRPGALCSDGPLFVTGGSDSIQIVDPASGKTVREVKTNYPVRALAAQGGRLFAMEQPIPGFDRQHKPIRVWPKQYGIHVIELPAAAGK
jgi:hypothetical protein